MAINFSSQSVVNTVTATSITFAFDNVSGNFVVVAGHDRNDATTAVTGGSYNGTALVLGPSVRTPSDRWNNILYWDNASPAPTGSNNVVVNASASVALRFSAYSYSGVDYDNPITGTNDTSSASAVATISTDITTVADGAWMFMFSKDNDGTKTITSGTGDSVRLATDAGGHAVSDTNAAISPAGLNTMTHNWTGNVNVGALAIAFKPLNVPVVPPNHSTLLTLGVG